MAKKSTYDAHPDAISWRNFPTDKTMNAFRAEYQQATSRERTPSDIWLRGAVKALEKDDEEKPIYEDLFSLRVIDDDIEHSTTPRLIPHEIQTLLWAIATVRDEDTKLKGDAFAGHVFSVLAKTVEQNDVEDSYVDTLILNQFRVQQELLRNFDGLLRQRLNLLYNHIFMNPEGIQINALRAVLEQVDYMLTGFSENTSSRKDTSAKKDLQMLYASLLALRKEVITEEAIKDSCVAKLNWRDKSDQLVEKMNEQLQNTRRSPSPKEVADFLSNYNEYLMKHLDPGIKEQAASFSEEYRKLKDYYYSDMDAEEFEKIVQKELTIFSQAIFDELDRMEQVDAVSDYRPKSAVVGYLRLKLTQVQEDILSKIQESLRILRTVYALHFFAYNPAGVNKGTYDEDKISGASKQMIALASKMLEECRYSLSSVREAMTLDQKIKSLYDAEFDSVYESGINGRMLEQLSYVLSTDKQSSVRYLFAAANLLRLMCKIYVKYECTKHLERILTDFDRIKKLLE